jgi:long-chain acyl-CoA synthetase
MHVTQGLRRAAQIKPNGTATVYRKRRHTWRETEDRVARLAAGLQKLGLPSGGRAAILALNSDRYFEYLLAVPNAGCVVVPINIRLAVPEITYILEDSGAEVLFIDDRFVPLLDALKGKIKTLREIVFLGDGVPPAGMCAFEELISAPRIAEAIGASDDLAGIFYTGGTTGKAKGVMLSHRNLVTNAANVVPAFGYDSEMIYLHAGPMFHLADGASTLAVTAVGGAHAFVPVFDPSDFLATVEREKVTHTLLVPTMINMLVNFPKIADFDVSTLRRVSYGASPMPDAVLRKALKTLPGVLFAHAYGMTEAAPLVSSLDPRYSTLEGPYAGRSKSCGQAALMVEVRIADTDDREVSRGTVGEVQVRGPNIMLGYWKKPDLSAEALRGGWYHTGDGGYMDEEGFVYIVDRLKDMIISGGENVYSAEVENAILLHDAVAEVAVIGIPDDTWGEAVHAIVVPRAGHTLTPGDIIAHCRGLIAGYKCPHSVVIRSEPMPLSGAGKILKSTLRAPYWEGRERIVQANVQ